MASIPSAWRRIMLPASLALAVTSVVIVAGPPDFVPLKIEDEAATAAIRPATAAESSTAFYYLDGKKVYLKDTGLGVASLKRGVQADLPNSPIKSAAITLSHPLADLTPLLQRSGMVIVNTRGPRSLNLKTAASDLADQVESIMPIVEPVDGPTTQGINGPSQLIMTPRIAARFKADLSEEEVKEYIRVLGLKVHTKQEIPGGYVLELAEGTPTYSRVIQAANRLYERGQIDDKVMYSHPDFVPTKKRLQAPADPLFNLQWHLKNQGTLGGKANADVGALDAWKISKGKPEIIIAIVDDSVEKNHPDLAPNFKKGRYYNGMTGTHSDDPSPHDATQMHGTSCAGVAVAASNTIGGCGLAPNCGLIGVNFWDASVAQTAESFYFCNNNGAAVISCSWSWGAAFDAVSLAIKDLYITGRGGKGTVILFAAGNETGTVSSQQQFGTLKEVICVGATNWRDDHSPYSNRGQEVCVVAPSSDRYWIRPDSLGIVTTDNTESGFLTPDGFSGYARGDYTPNKGEQSFGGTSSATPLVAGLCGLILSVKPGLTAKEIRQVLESTADKVTGELRVAQYDSNGHDVYYGYGRVNAKRALEKVAGPTVPPTVMELPVIVASATQGEIASAGEKDLYQFKAEQSAQYVIETEGSIDTFISLFGPNNQSTLIASDDDGGGNRNSRLALRLSPGTYFVQVRHYAATGTGNYGVKVSR